MKNGQKNEKLIQKKKNMKKFLKFTDNQKKIS